MNNDTDKYDKIIKDCETLNEKEFDEFLQECCNSYESGKFSIVPDSVYDGLCISYRQKFGHTFAPNNMPSSEIFTDADFDELKKIESSNVNNTKKRKSTVKTKGKEKASKKPKKTVAKTTKSIMTAAPTNILLLSSSSSSALADTCSSEMTTTTTNSKSFANITTLPGFISKLRAGKLKSDAEPPIGLREEIEMVKFMGSLNKTKDEKPLTYWMSKHEKDKFVSDKMDGTAASTDGKQLWTRGRDGRKGKLITHLMPFFNIPPLENNNLVRGEIIMPIHIFNARYNKSGASAEKIEGKVSNPRNTTAGIVSSKHPTALEASDIRYIAYEFVEDSNHPNIVLPQSEQFKRLISLGFDVPYYEHWLSGDPPSDTNGARLDDEDEKKEEDMSAGAASPFEYLTKLIKKRQSEAEYEMDGVVISENIRVELIDGENPKHMLAFKPKDEVLCSTVIAVDWEVSKNGTLRPVVQIEPIDLSGAKLRFATGNNARMIVDLKIGPGAIVRMVRAGKVIPKIVGVIKPALKLDLPKCEYEWAKTKRVKLAAIPGSEKEDEEMKKLGAGKDKNGYWIWYEQKQVHFAIKGGLENNDDHREMKIKQIISFFAKMKAKHVAEKTISKIFDHGYDTLGKIFDLKVEDISGEIEGFKEKSSGRFVDAVQSCIRDANMAKVAAASGVFGENIGEKKLEKIFQADKNILDSESSQEKLIDFIQNLGGIKTLAPQIASNFKKFKLWIRNHPQITFAVSDSSSDEDDQDDDDDQEEKEKEKKVVKKTDKKKTTKKKKKEEESEDEETESDEDSVDEKKVEKKEKKMTASSSSSSSSTPVTGIVNELKKKKPLLGKNICFTGARDQLLITTTIKLGAKIVDSVSKKLSYLVIGKKPGPSKVAKAEDLELQIITVENFKILISNFSK